MLYLVIIILCKILVVDSSVSVVESNLDTANAALKKQEKILTNTFNALNASATFSFKNIEAAKIVPSILTVLTDTINLANNFQTIDNYEPNSVFFEPTPCENAVYRSSLISYDAFKYSLVILNITRNSSALYEYGDKIYGIFSSNHKTLEMNFTRQRTIITIFNVLRRVFSEFWEYLGLIQSYIKYANDAVKYLDGLVSSSVITCPVTNSSIKEYAMTIDDELRAAQKELLALEAIALDKINTALKTVKTAINVNDSPTRMNLISLQNIFKATITADDPMLKWPRIPDIDAGDNGFYIKLRACNAKISEYENIKDFSIRNRTSVTKRYFDLDKSSKSVTNSRKVQASAVVNDVLNATWAVINKFEWFEEKCDIAIDKVRKMNIPVKSVCNMTRDILNGNGKTLKTACLITQQRTFNEAQRFCQANNMPSLYAVTNSIEQSGILSFASAIFNRYTEQNVLTINGFNEVTGNFWYNRNPIISPIYSALIPRVCAGMVGSATSFSLMAISCFRRCFVICEFDIRKQTPVLGSCNYRKNMTNGVYLKHACMSNTHSLTGTTYCKNNRMEGLFKIESAFELSELEVFAKFCADTVFGSSQGYAFCLNGYKPATSNTWYSFDSSVLPSTAVPTVYQQNFMKVSKSGSGPTFENFPNNPPLWFICEFKE